MSLEQTIADLVAASNNLTGAVNNKLGEIDEAVQKAVEAIPELSRTWYVDAVSGSDQAQGDTEAGSLKTIWEAMSRSKGIPFVTVVLKADQVHEFLGESTHMPYWEVPGALQFICSNDNGNTVIRPVVTTRFSESAINFLTPVDGGSVFFQDCTLELPQGLDEVDNPKHNSFARSFIDRGHQARFVAGSVLFGRSRLNLSSEWPLVNDSFPYDLGVVFHKTDIIDTNGIGDSQFIRVGNANMRLAVGGSTLPSSLGSWADIIEGISYDSSGRPINVLSNINLEQVV